MTRHWFTLLPLLLVAFSSRADVLHVNSVDPACNGASPCFGTIQAAVVAAAPGDVVRLHAGTYIESVVVSGKNAGSGASEGDRIRIEAAPEAEPGSVLLDGASNVCTNGAAIRFQQSKFVTVEGLVITGAGGAAVELMGGNNGNEGIHLERNRIFGNGSGSCSGGITIARGNPGTLIANNLIYANGRNGISTIDADGGPHRIVGNTIHANGWNGIRVTRSHDALLANNLIFGNGTAAGSTGGRFGVQREGSSAPNPAGIHLLDNLVCANRLGEIDGPVLDASDAGNQTPGGSEGNGVLAAPGCELAANVFEELGDPNGGQIDFGLAEDSPAVDRGIDPRTLGLGAGLDASFEADFSATDVRPLDGDGVGGAAFDAGALERGGAGPPPGPTPTVDITSHADGAVVMSSPLQVSGTATDADAVTVNGVAANLTGGSFAASIPLVEGVNGVSATASNAFGAATETLSVVLDSPPALTITSPADGELLTATSVLVTGNVLDATGLANVSVNGVVAEISGNAFSANVPLALGETLLVATATDSSGSTTSASATVTRGELPTFSVASPLDGEIVGSTLLLVTGSFGGTPPVSIIVDAVSAELSGSGFSASVPLEEGSNPLTVTASNAFGATTTSVTVVLDTTAPAVTIDSPADGSVTQLALVNVTGSVLDASSVSGVSVNGLAADFDGISFSVAVPLSPGANSIVATATDAAGNEGSASITVSFLPPPLALSISAPANGTTTTSSSVLVTGELNRSGAEVSVNGVGASVSGSTFEVSVPLQPLTNAITAVASLAGETVSDSITVVRVVNPPPPPPPDPVASAPPLSPDVASSVFAGTDFLYTGADPIQTGVTPGAIDVTRSAVIRGSVRQRSGAPLPSVRVTVKGHPQFGQTFTREDGMFDLALSGGGVFTLEYQRDGFLSVHRQVEALWQEFRFSDDVVMIPYDVAATSVSPSGATSYAIAQGSVVVDGDGARRVTALFAPGTTATMRLPNGTTQPVTQPFTVRATEYTVGPAGPDTMPAMLPATSGYTYAFEVSVDQAVASGATRVDFSQPVTVYNENFLGFPVGAPVPVGIYDFVKAAWTPEPSGIVLGVVSITGDRVDLDVDGNGSADTGAALANLGITDAERTTLAGLYPVGASLWRSRTTHFSPMDLNFPLVVNTAPANAIQPNTPTPNQRQGGDDCSSACGNSVISIENQGLAESVPIVGTPYTLHYSSERVPGRTLGKTALVIPLSGADLPPTVTEIELEVQVAGRRFRETFPPELNLTTLFDSWDGRDAYGRAVFGMQTASVRVGYRYVASYQGASRFFATNFGGGTGGSVFARGAIVLTRTQRVPLGGWDARAQGLGGWSLDVHHAYDPVGQILYRGDGSQRSSQVVPRILRRVAGGRQTGNNNGGPNTGDGGPATSALFPDLSDLVVGEDGSIWVSTPGPGGPRAAIRRIGPDGIINRVIGGNTGCGNAGGGPTGENGPALAACLPAPQELDLGPDGSVYIGYAGLDNGFVQRVAADNIIRRFLGTRIRDPYQDGVHRLAANISLLRGLATAVDGAVYVGDLPHRRVRVATPDDLMFAMAGNGLSGETGDGGAALNASVASTELAVAPDGSLLIGTGTRVRRVRPDGLIETIAGGGVPLSGVGDGLPARQAKLQQVRRIAFAPDGGLYIAEGGDNAGTTGPRVRYVDMNGIISTIVGTGAAGSPVFGNPVQNNPIGEVRGMDVAPDGTLYLATTHIIAGPNILDRESFVISVRSSFPTVGTQDVLVPSDDGSEIYVFDGRGRHLRTLHPLTGATLLTFEYDAAGRLAAVVDANSNRTELLRNAAGAPTAIVAPFGQTTALTRNSEGFLATITNPASERVSLSYYPGGLLQRFEKPSGDASTFAYDSVGRLTSDANAAGGLLELSQSEDATSTTVEMVSALGVVQTYTVDDLADGSGRERTATQLVGPFSNIPLSSVSFRARNGTRSTLHPDGTEVELLTARDPTPGLGSQAPFVSASTVSTPGGLASSTTRVRTVTTTAGALATRTDTSTVNGKISTELFTAATREFLTTTPEGRFLSRTIDAAGRTTRVEVDGLFPVDFSYDAAGRLASVSQGTGVDQRITSFEYDSAGRLTDVTDPMLRSTSFTHDAAGRVLTETLPDLRQVGFTYDVNGNLASLTPPGQPAHVFGYTTIDQEAEYLPPHVAGISDPRTFLDYNLDKQLDLVTRPDGVVLDYQYDTAGRFASLVTPSGTTLFGYSDGTPLAPGSGNVSSITAPGGETLAFGYDGSLLTSTSWGGPASGSVSQTYDAFFRPTSQRVNGGSLVSFAYDDDGLLVQAGAESLTLDALTGLLTGTSLGSVTTSMGYSAFGELGSDSASLGGASFYANSYVRDKLGRITQKTETLLGVTSVHGYAYDQGGRLEHVTTNGSLAASYVHDANGNRLSATTPGGTTAGSYDAQDRLISYGTLSYAYTANGNLVSKTDSATSQTTSYVYDALGNLVSASLPDGRSLGYVIDGLSRRVGKRVNGVLVQGWLYQDALEPVAELDGAGSVVSRFVYGSRPHVPDYMVRGGQTYRMVSDHLGSVRLVVNTSTGAVVQRIDYDEFGNITSDTNPGFQPFGFAGGLYDADTGFTRFGARDYDPQIGRWTTKDPIRFAGGDPNLYGYVLGDPVNLVDSSGLATVSVGITGNVGAAGGGVGGGTFLNFGYSADSGFSFSITGTAGAGASAAAGGGPGALFGGGVGFTFVVSGACDVSGLLGSAKELSRGGVGRAGAGVFSSSTANGAFFTIGPRGSSVGTTAASASVTTTSAIVQYSNGRVSVGNTGSGALISF